MVFILFTSGLFPCMIFFVHDLIRFVSDKWSSSLFERFLNLVSHLALHLSGWCIYGIVINLLFRKFKNLAMVCAILIMLVLVRRFCAHVDVYTRKWRDIIICTVSSFVCFASFGIAFKTVFTIKVATV